MFCSRFLPLSILFILAPTHALAAEPEKMTPKQALQAVHDLIGAWSGTGEPSQGTREEKQRNFWVESINWVWQFKGEDVFLKVGFGKSKYFIRGELRYL